MWIVAILPLVATPLGAQAAGGGGGENDTMWQAVNLAIILGALIFFARKPVAEFFATPLPSPGS